MSIEYDSRKDLNLIEGFINRDFPVNVEVSRQECAEKKNEFFQCVINDKKELTSNMTKNDWVNYNEKVHDISKDCYASKGLKSCISYFSFYDINY